jgi:hypothetical protein
MEQRHGLGKTNILKNVNDMGEKNVEENIRTDKGERAVED